MNMRLEEWEQIAEVLELRGYSSPMRFRVTMSDGVWIDGELIWSAKYVSADFQPGGYVGPLDMPLTVALTADGSDWQEFRVEQLDESHAMVMPVTPGADSN